MPTKAKKTAAKKPKSKASGSSDAAFIKKKAASSGFSESTLRKVMARGKAAYLSSGSRSVPMAAWARGRVNSFVSGKGGARKADADLLKKKRKA